MYVVERLEGEPNSTFIQAIDLLTGARRWRATIPHQDPEKTDDDVMLVLTGNGRHLAVALGDRAWDTFELQQLAIVDALSGTVLGPKQTPEGWRRLALLAGADGATFVALRIHAIRGTSESPTYSFTGISTMDPQSGRVVDIYDPAAGMQSDEERERARWQTPLGGLALGDREFLLVPRGDSDSYLPDPIPPDQTQRRGDAVRALLEQ
ncbi:MAG: hypothetical protein H0V89_11670 [Deltaproteobacteria bacterium]|nr:hypothetical protein [Deltaproteobacteria bacterium]